MVEQTDFIVSLRQRAEAAREEGTGTAQGDAWHFDKSADLITELVGALRDIEAGTADRRYDPLLDTICRRARAALRKAEGGEP